MKCNKQLTAFLLSLALLTGMAFPSFAEEDTSGSGTPAAQQNTANQTEQTPSNSPTPSAESEEPEKKLTPVISLDAKACILVNEETGEIIHQENAKEKQYPASTTKIMTALLALENCNLDDIVTMQSSDFVDVKNGASNAGLKETEQITVENLLYCLMLPSGNEAANALARHTAGSLDAFVQMMNDRAKELGCVNTHFMNANGLHKENHYSCAYDLYLIARQAMQNSTFATVVNTAQKRLPATNMNPERVIFTTNHLILSSYSTIYYDNCYGIKTGHTTQAGYCLVSYAKQSGNTYYSVVLGAKEGNGSYPGSFTETKRLFEWAFQNYRMQTATEAGEPVTECPVRLGKGSDYVTLVTADTIPVLIPREATASDLTVKVVTEDSYDAPITKGQKLGSVTYSFEGMECASADLIALTGIERSPVLYVLDQIRKFFQLTAIRIVLLILVVLFLVYLILSFIAGRNRRRNLLRKRKKQKRRNNNSNRKL